MKKVIIILSAVALIASGCGSKHQITITPIDLELMDYPPLYRMNYYEVSNYERLSKDELLELLENFVQVNCPENEIAQYELYFISFYKKSLGVDYRQYIVEKRYHWDEFPVISEQKDKNVALIYYEKLNEDNEIRLCHRILYDKSSAVLEKTDTVQIKTDSNMIEKVETTEENTIDDDGTDDYRRNLEIVNADYGTCYAIGEYMLCPEKKLIRVERMFGTAVIDAFGYFPEPSLKYDEVTMIIFAGQAFFDKSKLNIDWQKVQLLSYRDGEFTDGKNLYRLNYGDVYKEDKKYDKNTYKPPTVEKEEIEYFDEFFGDEISELTEKEYADLMKQIAINKQNRKPLGAEKYVSYYVFKNTFYYKYDPILEPFDVPNLRTIVSKSGFETDFVTDGKQVIFTGSVRGVYNSVSHPTINGKKYISVKELMIEGVDFASLRILGKNMMVDKNAIYNGTEVIPFDKLNGFKFIIRDIP